MTRIDWCPVERIPELQRLIDRHWRAGHVLASDETLLRWQYRHVTHTDRLAVMVATDDATDELIGCLGLIQAPFNDRGRRRLALWMSMWLLVPEARGQGIGFALLDRAVRDGHEVIACVGFNDITRRLVAGMGFHVSDAVPRWVRPVSLPPLLALADARERPYRGAIRERWASIAATAPPAAGGRVEPWAAADAEPWDRTWREKLAPGCLATWHDSEYLRWRYLEHPSFRYEVRVARDEEGGVEGLLVYRVERVRDRHERVFRIVELLGGARASEALVRHAVAAASGEGAPFADFECTAVGEQAAALARHGFYRDDEQAEEDRLPRFFQPLDFRPKALNFTLWTGPQVHPDVDELLAGSEPYFTRADGDQDRPN